MFLPPAHYYQCPICQSAFTVEAQRWYCANQPKSHSFDVARQGYINLLPAQHKKSKQPGDDAQMVQARKDFLATGFYQPLQTALCQLISTHAPQDQAHLLDVGCGEGYYTQQMAKKVACTTAVDISKVAVQTTAKLKCHHTVAMVASAAKLPVANASAHIITSVFSPILPQELARVLADDGVLIIAKPEPTHLLALRQILFDEVTPHYSDKFISQLADFFSLVEKKPLAFSGVLENAALKNLIAMTPYAYKAKPKNREKAESLAALEVTAHIALYVFQKK